MGRSLSVSEGLALLRASELAPADRLLWLELLEQAGGQLGEPVAVTMADLGSRVGSSASSIQRALRRLEQAGWATISLRAGRRSEVLLQALSSVGPVNLTGAGSGSSAEGGQIGRGSPTKGGQSGWGRAAEADQRLALAPHPDGEIYGLAVRALARVLDGEPGGELRAALLAAVAAQPARAFNAVLRVVQAAPADSEAALAAELAALLP